MHAEFEFYLRSQALSVLNWPWYVFAAYQAMSQGHVQWIPSRDRSSLYLARFWLSLPSPAAPSSSSPFEESQSTILHWFARGDDDCALHDHPWDFTTTLLAGGYDERRPTDAYLEAWESGAWPLGPLWEETTLLRRRAGDGMPPLKRRAIDMHAVENVLPDTWTLVQTEAKQRSWGFWPQGEARMPWRAFLGRKAAAHATAITPAAPAATEHLS